MEAISQIKCVSMRVLLKMQKMYMHLSFLKVYVHLRDDETMENRKLDSMSNNWRNFLWKQNLPIVCQKLK